MSYMPVIPNTGLAGWQFLQRTYDAQFEAFNTSSQLQREADYFTDNIGDIQSAEDLVADRRLLKVALGAYGLQDDIDNRYFIQKILSDGVGSDDALANKLSDERYARLSEAFGFGPGETATTGLAGKMADVVQLYRTQSFEVSVGEQDDTMRVALYAQRELTELAEKDVSEETKWFTLMGLAPLRSMFETALGLPSAFGQIDIDQQLEVLQDKTAAITGDDSVSQFSDPENLEKLTTHYLARSQIAGLNAANSSGANALALLQSVGY
ncbi:DUF1217 domain-containing protein [Rhodobacteraceae bacterium F11138]|nr:DUF1217 domain-containing protein [Rhodobacteraceae bacterium F11138]